MFPNSNSNQKNQKNPNIEQLYDKISLLLSLTVVPDSKVLFRMPPPAGPTTPVFQPSALPAFRRQLSTVTVGPPTDYLPPYHDCGKPSMELSGVVWMNLLQVETPCTRGGPARNRTGASRPAGERAYHYTTEPCVCRVMFVDT